MPVDVSIKKVPDDVIELIRMRAKRNHRSVQGELMAILEQATKPKKRSFEEVYEELGRIGLNSPSESVRMIREDRDAR